MALRKNLPKALQLLIKEARPPSQGYRRSWHQCKVCKTYCHLDFVPYSLSSAILIPPCGHTFHPARSSHQFKEIEVEEKPKEGRYRLVYNSKHQLEIRQVSWNNPLGEPLEKLLGRAAKMKEQTVREAERTVRKAEREFERAVAQRASKLRLWKLNKKRPELIG